MQHGSKPKNPLKEICLGLVLVNSSKMLCISKEMLALMLCRLLKQEKISLPIDCDNQSVMLKSLWENASRTNHPD